MADGDLTLDDDGNVFLADEGNADICEDCCDAFCVSVCANPSILVTVSWTGPEATQTIWTESWTNGESKKLCPTSYTADATDEYWSIGPTSGVDALRVHGFDDGVTWRQNVTLRRIPYTSGAVTGRYWTLARQWTNGAGPGGISSYIASYTLDGPVTTLTPTGNFVDDSLFGTLTTNYGLTVVWKRCDEPDWVKPV
jgi:hypothetical protein